MIKKVLFIFVNLFVLSFFILPLKAQDKWSLKFSYGLNNGSTKQYKDLIRDNSKLSHFRLDANYNVFNNLYTGVYVGYSKLRMPESEQSTYVDENGQEIPILAYSFTRTNAIYYGIDLNYQLLPLFTGKRNLRFELYPTVKLGCVSEFWKMAAENTPMSPLKKYSNTEFEFGIGLGAGYKFTRNFGVFGEGTFGNFYNDQKFRFHAGVQFNF